MAQKVGICNLPLLNKFVSKNLVCGVPNLQFLDTRVYDIYVKVKQTISYFKQNKQVSTIRTLELLHINLCGPVNIQSREGKRYVFVNVDDYSSFTWTMLLRTMDETYKVLVIFAKQIQVKQNNKIVGFRSYHGIKFENAKVEEFCVEYGISHNFAIL